MHVRVGHNVLVTMCWSQCVGHNVLVIITNDNPEPQAGAARDRECRAADHPGAATADTPRQRTHPQPMLKHHHGGWHVLVRCPGWVPRVGAPGGCPGWVVLKQLVMFGSVPRGGWWCGQGWRAPENKMTQEEFESCPVWFLKEIQVQKQTTTPSSPTAF